MMHEPVEIGIAQWTLSGEVETGDRCLVKLSGNCAMIAVVDGLGHGVDAARAATAAIEVIDSFAHEPVDSLLLRCHRRLRDTRGAAITLLMIDYMAGTLEWVGVGNVIAVLLRPETGVTLNCKELLVRSGTVGIVLPSSAPSSIAIAQGDMVAVATDGVRPGFMSAITRPAPCQGLAERLLAKYRTRNDDALVVVARVHMEVR